MQCDEFEIRLHEVLDRRVSPDDDAALCAHAEQCVDCAETMSLYVSMTGAIRQMPKSAPPVKLPFEVLHQVDQSRQTSERRWRVQRAVAAVLATAAGLLIAFSLWQSGRDVGPTTAPDESSVLIASGGPATFDYVKFAEETQELANYITTRQLQVMNELAEGMRPVASSFGAAFQTLRSTLPYGAASSAASG